jgi:hypothetical protein
MLQRAKLLTTISHIHYHLSLTRLNAKSNFRCLLLTLWKLRHVTQKWLNDLNSIKAANFLTSEIQSDSRLECSTGRLSTTQHTCRQSCRKLPEVWEIDTPSALAKAPNLRRLRTRILQLCEAQQSWTKKTILGRLLLLKTELLSLDNQSKRDLLCKKSWMAARRNHATPCSRAIRPPWCRKSFKRRSE